MPRAAVQDALRPQRHRRIAGGLREAQAFVDQAHAELQSSGARIDDQQAELRHLVRLAHHEGRADALAVQFGDPAALAPGIEVLDELGCDLSDQRLERNVPAILARIERAVRGGDPAHVADLMLAQNNRPGWLRIGRGCAERCFDRAHRGNDALLLGLAHRAEHRCDLIVRPLVQRRECLAALRRDGDQALARVVRGALLREQAVFGETPQDATEIAVVEVERRGKLACGGPVAMRQLVKHTPFGERKTRVHQAFPQQA